VIQALTDISDRTVRHKQTLRFEDVECDSSLKWGYVRPHPFTVLNYYLVRSAMLLLNSSHVCMMKKN
jgi:hypothetical protein